jgi:hypothetical protein
VPFQKRFQALPHNRMVINQQYANCHSGSILWGDQTIRHILSFVCDKPDQNL